MHAPYDRAYTLKITRKGLLNKEAAGLQSGKVAPDVIVNFVEAPLVCGWPGPATGWPPPIQTSTAPGTTRRIPLSSTMLRSRSRSAKLTDCEAEASRWIR